MQAVVDRRQSEPNEVLGGLGLGAIALTIFAAFAFSPLGTIAALFVLPVAFLTSIRVDEKGGGALVAVQRLSVVIALLGVVAAFVLF